MLGKEDANECHLRSKYIGDWVLLLNKNLSGSGDDGVCSSYNDGALVWVRYLLDTRPLIDLQRLRDFGSDQPGFVEEILTLFRESLTQKLIGLETAFAAGDHVGLRHDAHALLGEAANLGAPTLVSVAQVLEQGAETGDLAGMNDAMPALRDRCEEMIVWIDQVLGASLEDHDPR